MRFPRLPLFIDHSWTILAGEDEEKITKHFPTMDTVFAIDAAIISKSLQSEIFSYVIEGKTFFIKRYFRSIGIGSWLGFSRFRLETKNQRWFNAMQLPSAPVIAYGEERFLLKTLRGVLITEAISNTDDLAAIAIQQPDKFENRTWRTGLIKEVAAILRFFHAHRFCHNDLHWRNILVEEGQDNVVKVHLIDCPHGKHLFWPFLSYKKLKDLANIDKLAPQYLSRTQRLRFFLHYRDIKRLSNADKTMIRHILKHKSNRIKRKARETRKKR